MQELFNLVLTTSIYSAIVGVILLFIKSILGNRLNARWHYVLWTVLIFKLLVPFGPESSISLFNAVPDTYYSDSRSMTGLNYNEITEVIEAVPAVYSAAGIESEGLTIRAILPLPWALGSAAMLLWLLISYIRLCKSIKSSTKEVEDRLIHIYQRCLAKLSIDKSMPLVMQEAVGTPSLIGAWRPRILLTPSVLSLSDKELEYVLLHELAHYKRRDMYMNYLLLGFQVIHWFNPVMWYCFHKIRQDMELATDEYVLSLLNEQEHKDYGKALLAVLEGFAAPRIVPRLLAMADDKKSIEKRLKMIKMAELFKRKRRLVILSGLLCVALLSAVLLTDGLKPTDVLADDRSPYNAQKLLQYRTPYVGDAVKVNAIVENLPYGEYKTSVSLQTTERPYGITITYEFDDPQLQEDFMNLDYIQQHSNANILFALIENVDEISFDLPKAKHRFTYRRLTMQNQYPEDIYDYSKNIDRFNEFLQGQYFNVIPKPISYTPLMSSTPGIKLSAWYIGKTGGEAAQKIKEVKRIYSTEYGALFTWDGATGKLSERKKVLEVTAGTEVYWAPLENEGESFAGRTNTVTIQLLDQKERILLETAVPIRNTEPMYYTVQKALGVRLSWDRETLSAKTLEDSVSEAIINRASSYRRGEVAVEGHHLLSIKEDGSQVIVYAIASVGNFAFENGTFTKISGSGAIPTIITLSNDPQHQYKLLDYQEPMDGGAFTSSVKDMFPKNLHENVLNAERYSNSLGDQQRARAQEYLQRIGRNARATVEPVKKKPLSINVEASNKLFSELAKTDIFINTCPYWSGSVEQLEEGIRYIYETAQGVSVDGHDMVIFTKKQSGGAIVEERKYEILGSEPRLLQ